MWVWTGGQRWRRLRLFYRSLVPGAELVILEESSHLPHLEEPERYLEVLRDFLHRFDQTTSEEGP